MSIVTPNVSSEAIVSAPVPVCSGTRELEQKVTEKPVTEKSASKRKSPPKFHRINEVRQQQGVSIRTAARHLKLDTATVREQENATTDLKISDLCRWQEVLEVPLADLLVDNGAPLSQPVMERARLVRLMKTAAAIEEKAESSSVKRLAKMMMDQLIEVMPELKEVSAWHSVGQRRSLDEVGQIVERRLRDDFFMSHRDE